MLNCPHHGICASCRHVKSMPVGKNQRDRVYSCSKINPLFLTRLGYDSHSQGNRMVPVRPILESCLETIHRNELTGGWF